MGDKTRQRSMSGVVKKGGKEFTPPFPFFSFSFSCLFVLPDEITKEEEKRRYNYKEGKFHETFTFKEKATAVRAKWELSFFAQIFPL